MTNTNLQPTYGNFKVRGIVSGLQSDYAFIEKTSDSGFTHRTLKFNVKTSPDNIVQVKLWAGKFDKLKITTSDRDDDREDQYLDYTDDVYNNIPEGYEPFMGVSIGLTQNDEGKNVTVKRAGFDAVKEIYDNLKDGDVVFVKGRNKFRKHNENIYEELEINGIFHSTANMDFESEEFEELSAFDQTVVLVDGELDKNTKRANLTTYIITDKEGTFVQYPFHVDANKGKKYANMGKKLAKFPFGTQIKLVGNLLRTVEYEDVDDSLDEDDDDDLMADRPKGYEKQNKNKQGIKNVIKEFEVTGAFSESIIEEKYSEDDFIPQKDNDNPFENDVNEGNDNDLMGEDPFSNSGEGNSDEDPFA